MDNNTLWTVVGFGLATLSFLLNLFLGVRKRHLQERLTAEERKCSVLETRYVQGESRLKDLQTYAEKTRVISPRYLDVVLLGPRGSGKTALSRMWRAPFTEIGRVEATVEKFIRHDIAVYEGDEYAGHDDLFNVQRTYLPQYRLNIIDYAGEDDRKWEALQTLRTKSQAVLVLFFPCIRTRDMDAVVSSESLKEVCQKNLEYFSSHFVNQLANLPQLGQNVVRAFAVFSRVDQLPQFGNPNIENVEELHRQSLGQLRTTFGKERLNVWHISARTNANTFNLLGAITKLFFDDLELPPKLREQLQTATHLAYEFKGDI